jgi:hypothetical protein
MLIFENVPQNAFQTIPTFHLNPLKAELNPTCHLLALLRAHHILHFGRIRVKHCFSARMFKILRGTPHWIAGTNDR